MYQLFFDGSLVYDPRIARYQIREPDIHLAVGEPGEVAFTIDADHPCYDRLTKLKGQLMLASNGSPIWRGRIIKDTRDFYLSREIEAEGLFACLNDSIIPPFDFPGDFLNLADYQAAAAGGNVVEYFLGWVIDLHNSQVGPAQQLQLGEVTVSDPNNYITRSSTKYNTAMQTVKEKLVKLLGGYLVTDYASEVPVVNYYDTLPYTNLQKVEYGGNLLDLVTEVDAADTYTAIYPVGAEGLTIADLDDEELDGDLVKDGNIIYSRKSEQDTGSRIIHFMEWKDVTEAANLRRKAMDELAQSGTRLAQTITARAADLGGLDGVPRFRVGLNVELNSTPHGFRAVYPLMELDPDIFDPGKTVIVLGSTIKSASDIAYDNMLQTNIQLEEQRKDFENLDFDFDVGTEVQTQITTAIQNSESVIFAALEEYVRTSNFEAYKESVSAQLSLLSDEVNISITQSTERIEAINGDLQAKFNTLTKYFTFTVDGMTIGAVDNPNKVVIDNDEISILVNGVVVQRFDANGRALIPELDITRTLNLLGYQLSKDSAGNVNCQYVGG